jgi:hypothetical protein
MTKDSIMDSEVAWNSSQLFYQYLYEIDMDFKDAYYANNWDGMYKSFKLKYMRVRVFILKIASEEEKNLLNNDSEISKEISKFKRSDSDFSNRFNSDIVNNISEIIEKKMILVDELMSRAGMNLLLEKIKEYRPAALSNDDFVID